MKKEDIIKEIKDLSWNDLRTYCKDSGIEVKGKGKDVLVQEAIEVRWANVLTLKQQGTIDNDVIYETIEKETDTTKIMGRLIDCHIQNLNPNESKLPNKIITIGNMEKGFDLPSYIVEFNKEQRLPAVIVSHLQTEKFRTSKQVKNAEGVKVTVNIRHKAYNVTILPPKKLVKK